MTMNEVQANELGKRAVAAGLNMMAGMLIRNDKCDIRIASVYDDVILYSGAYGEEMGVDEAKKSFWPDFRDPGTLGCLRAQVVALVPQAVEVRPWDSYGLNHTAGVMWLDGADQLVGQQQLMPVGRPTWPIEALVRALEAAKEGTL